MFELRGESGLVLRSYRESDAAAVFATVHANRAHLEPWLPWVEHTRSAEDILAFVGAAARQLTDELGFQGGIWTPAGFAGGIGCRPIDWPNRKTELGYWLAAPAQGRGIATAAARLLTGHCFEAWKLNRVEIRCAAGNVRSCAVAERLGFRFEGVQREAQWIRGRALDLRTYALLAREWPAR